MTSYKINLFVDLVNAITFLPGWQLRYSFSLTDGDSWIQWAWKDKDHIKIGENFYCKGRKWRISEHMTKSEFVQTAFAAAKMCMIHETREIFKFEGYPVMRPHFDVDKLIELCKLDAIDKREEVTPK